MKTSTVAVASMMLLGAALAQARHFVVLEAVASRTYTNLFKTVEAKDKPIEVELVKPLEPKKSGGEQPMHKIIKTNLDDNVAYIESLLAPLKGLIRNEEDHSVDVYVFGAGGVRLLGDKEAQFWDNVKAAIETFANTPEGAKFKFGGAETRTGVQEAKVGLQTAKKLTKDKNAVLVWISAVSLQMAYETDDEYLAVAYAELGSVFASETYTNELAAKNSPNYAKAAAEEVKLEEDVYGTNSRDKEANAMKRKNMMNQLKEGGRLSGYQGEIDHPCLMLSTKGEALEMVEFFTDRKTNPTAYREIAPFKGTGDYEKCFESIAAMIDRTVTPKKFDAPKTAPVVGMGTLYHNTFNLENFQIIPEGGLQTVGDLVEASKRACSISFSEALTQFKRLEAEAKEWNELFKEGKKLTEKKTISPHCLVELCWASTHSTVLLKHTLGLDDSQPLFIGRASVTEDAAFKIARGQIVRDEL